MANANHYQAAEDRLDGHRLTEIELGRAQVHATLALTDILRGILAELTAIRQAAQLSSTESPPTGR
jgi:hypothetical protein